MAATRTVQEAGVLAQVRNHMAHAAFSNVARNAFAHAVQAALFFGFIQSARRFNLKRIAKKQRESSAKHAEFGFQNVKHILEQLFNVAFVNDRNTDLLDDRDF